MRVGPVRSGLGVSDPDAGWIAVTSITLCRPGRPDSTWLAVACASHAYVIQSAAVTAATRDVYLYTLFARQFTTLPLIALVVALARGIYDEKAFDRMPILADALQDAGCDNDDVLSHCRGGGPHVRGCWVVDLLLGKE